jgi:hypothetical protein
MQQINSKEIKNMSNDEVVLSGSVVGKVLEVARACVDEKRKGWFVNMKQFRDAMDGLNLDSREVSEALAYLKARMYVITFPDADGEALKSASCHSGINAGSAKCGWTCETSVNTILMIA